MVLRRDISADYVAVGALRDEIIAIAERHGLAGEALFAAKLATEEILINAIKRRRASAAAVRMRVEAEITGAGVKLTAREAD